MMPKPSPFNPDHDGKWPFHILPLGEAGRDQVLAKVLCDPATVAKAMDNCLREYVDGLISPNGEKIMRLTQERLDRRVEVVVKTELDILADWIAQQIRNHLKEHVLLALTKLDLQVDLKLGQTKIVLGNDGPGEPPNPVA